MTEEEVSYSTAIQQQLCGYMWVYISTDKHIPTSVEGEC